MSMISHIIMRQTLILKIGTIITKIAGRIWRSSLLSNYSYSCKLYVFVAFSFKYFVFVLYKEEVTSHNINVVKPLLLGVSFVSS